MYITLYYSYWHISNNATTTIFKKSVLSIVKSYVKDISKIPTAGNGLVNICRAVTVSFFLRHDTLQILFNSLANDLEKILITPVHYYLTHSHTMTPFDAPGKQALRKHCGKRRNCSYRAISLFPTVLSTRLDNFLLFSSSLKLSSANSFN